MKCPNCQTENPSDARFCNGCGQKLDLACPECGKTNPPGSRFCKGCGQKLSLPYGPTPKDLSFDEKLDKIQRYLPQGLTEKILSQRDKIEGERKQLTVMFCDMEGFTPLVEQIGAEEAYIIMDQVYELLIHKVHDYEGTVNEMTGDGIMAEENGICTDARIALGAVAPSPILAKAAEELIIGRPMDKDLPTKRRGWRWKRHAP
jgi:hypothetical protein